MPLDDAAPLREARVTAPQDSSASAPQDPPAPTPGAPDATDAPHAAVSMLDRLAERLGGRAQASLVYGEPVTREHVTVIPVAKVAFGFGGGTGRAAGGNNSGEGAGGGGGLEAVPIGFIEVTSGAATYKPIRDTWRDAIVPLAALLVGTLTPKVIRALVSRRS
ncbi:spore germination protein GerW family protein [Streptomyces sp. NPDC003077]|uniref:spore germination protein GerW family protein n=1 Tax=Streptomyces sp. NPDC003077 TaxID=3154443 RepID=UPI0033B7F76E